MNNDCIGSEGHFPIYRPINDKTLPWPGLFLGVPLLGFWYWSTNQYIVQKFQVQKISKCSLRCLLGGFLKLILYLLWSFRGNGHKYLFWNRKSRHGVSHDCIKCTSKRLIGLVLAGLISAIMSSVDSTLNSSSTLVVVDFIKPKISNISQMIL